MSVTACRTEKLRQIATEHIEDNFSLLKQYHHNYVSLALTVLIQIYSYPYPLSLILRQIFRTLPYHYTAGIDAIPIK